MLVYGTSLSTFIEFRGNNISDGYASNPLPTAEMILVEIIRMKNWDQAIPIGFRLPFMASGLTDIMLRDRKGNQSLDSLYIYTCVFIYIYDM